ncbi:hypothetical protein Baya_16101 [Bagarius yarrelli]|uniref:Uncharacterized protein n=1 Tax=Bagarius yarrelli TaxID=175774 RepID=A0A556VUD1_BAGYA|nr:hypothetical protein Baya_16101 [Bagarius yarrelli]
MAVLPGDECGNGLWRKATQKRSSTELVRGPDILQERMKLPLMTEGYGTTELRTTDGVMQMEGGVQVNNSKVFVTFFTYPIVRMAGFVIQDYVLESFYIIKIHLL